MNSKGHRRAARSGALYEGAVAAAASCLCIAIGLALGVAVLAALDVRHALGDGLAVLVTSGFSSARSMGTVLAQTAPLIMTGLSVGFAFRAGLFNVGVAGQYTLGAFGGLYSAIVLQLPWYACLLASMLCGAIWGAIPGVLKACLHTHEVISAILLNWIGLYMVNEIMYGRGKSPMYDSVSTKTYSLRKAAPQAMIPSGGLGECFGQLESMTAAIFIALFFVAVVYVLLRRTAFGYELRACGLNPLAAQYAGIDDRRSVILAMMIAGALAGGGAGLYYLSTVAEWNPQASTALPVMGWSGISAAMLACANPIGTVFSSFLIAYLFVGGAKLPTQYYAREIADVIAALIIYLCAFSMLFRGRIRGLLRRGARAGEEGR